MTFAEAYRYLAKLKKIPRREYLLDPALCVVYLERLQKLLDLLGNPEKKIPHYIHIAGTSGKGSTGLMLESIWRKAGHRTGLLLSPGVDGLIAHALVNGQPLRPTALTRLVTKIKSALDYYQKNKLGDVPSTFEIFTALTLLHFAEKKVEWAILEVGLGGRYDSTNVIPYKDIAIVTNIGFDHTELLGRTRAKIAVEKAGIIKAGSRVFTAEEHPAALRVIERECQQEQAPLKKISSNNYQLKKISFGQLSFVYQKKIYHLPTFAEHQIKNALLAIEAAKAIHIPQSTIKKGLAFVRLPIRLELTQRRPAIILDGAHNPDKMQATVAAIKMLRHDGIIKPTANIHLVVGFAADKNWTTMLRQLAGLKPRSIACARFTKNTSRAVAEPAEIARRFETLLPGATVRSFSQPKAALAWSRRQQKTSDLLLVTGSMYLSGEVRLLFFAK